MTPVPRTSLPEAEGRRGRTGVGGLALLAALLLAAPAAAARPAACEADDGGLELAEGWCAGVFARELGAVRNLAVAPDGTLYLARKDADEPAGLALRDADGNGRAEQEASFGPPGPAHDVLVEEGRVWLAYDRRILRFSRGAGALAPEGQGEVVVQGLPEQAQHARKAIALREGHLFVNIGAPSNACQKEMRTPRSPGVDPCPQLERHAGIWRFDAEAKAQSQADGARFVTGIRHVLALAVHPANGQLWGVMNGRDQLHSLWDFPVEKNAKLPAEEMLALDEGDDFGWPYCYHDGLAGKKVLAPEYGGDGERVGRCAQAEAPALAFPAHWAPMDLAFAGPEVALVAFRGSWNRAPLPQEGYRVTRVALDEGRPTGSFSTFAIGAASRTGLRFTGVAVGPDGAIYAAAENVGRVWRIVSTGEAR